MIPKYIKASDVRVGDTIVWNTASEENPLVYAVIKEVEEGEKDDGTPAIIFIGAKYTGDGKEYGKQYHYPAVDTLPTKFKILLIDRKEKDRLDFGFKK